MVKKKEKAYPIIHVLCGSGHTGNMALELYQRLKKAGKMVCPYCKTRNYMILSEDTYDHLNLIEAMTDNILHPRKPMVVFEDTLPIFKCKNELNGD